VLDNPLGQPNTVIVVVIVNIATATYKQTCDYPAVYTDVECLVKLNGMSLVKCFRFCHIAAVVHSVTLSLTLAMKDLVPAIPSVTVVHVLDHFISLVDRERWCCLTFHSY